MIMKIILHDTMVIDILKHYVKMLNITYISCVQQKINERMNACET